MSIVINRPGYDRLWHWFGLSRASWLTIPRVLMHEMPDEWQEKMAALLEEYDEVHDFSSIEIETRVQGKRNGRFCSLPRWLSDYRHPDHKEIAKIKEKL